MKSYIFFSPYVLLSVVILAFLGALRKTLSPAGVEGGYERIDERICPCFTPCLESRLRKVLEKQYLFRGSVRFQLFFFFCLEPWSKDCMTFTLHDLTDFYVERVTAYCIKINYHSCFHNRFLNSKTKLKLKHILEQGGPWCLGLYACLCACVSVSLCVCVCVVYEDTNVYNGMGMPGITRRR